MKSSRIILCWIVLLTGCTPYLPEPVKTSPRGSDAVVLDNTTVLSSSDSLVFESQFSFLDLAGYYDLGGITANDFTFTSPGIYSILDFKDSVQTGITRTAVVVLEDESGDYATLDPYNYRSKMINKFCQNIQPPGSFMVGGYSRQGKITAPVEFSSDVFSTDWLGMQNFIFSLPDLTGGNSSLYDALSLAISRLNAGSSPDKNIVVLAHANDGGSTATLSGLISTAVASQVKVHILFLGSKEGVGDLAQLSGLTGGMFAILPSDQELITVFNQFYRLLTGQRYVYYMKVSYRPASGVLTTGGINHTLSIVNYVNNQGFNPVVIYTPVP